MPSLDLVSQIAHVAIGTSIMWGCTLFIPEVFGWWRQLIGFLSTIAWGIVKDYGYDIVVEEDSWSGSTIDIAFYLVGAAAAWLAVVLFHS